jgi:6-phosphogluconate dehydrogenase
MKKEIGIIGLGKMGSALALNLKEKGWNVIAYNRTVARVDEIEKQGVTGARSIEELVNKLESPRIIWTMLTAGEATISTIFGEEGLTTFLGAGDTIIEGGNSKFSEDQNNANELLKFYINYIDVGVSGGPYGARHGACLMIGGQRENFINNEQLFKDLSKDNSYKFFEGYGAGHYVKMVHNGIEYGMMQSIAEGFNLLKNSNYKLNLEDVADIYNNGSVIESRLINWLKEGYLKYGEDLESVSGTVSATGEGLWTVEDANMNDIKVPVIQESVNFRNQTQNNPNYTGKILSMLRNMFGGHSI